MKRYKIVKGNRNDKEITFEINGKEIKRKVSKAGIIKYNSKKYFPVFENYIEGYVTELPNEVENMDNEINSYFDLKNILNGLVEYYKQFEVQNTQTESGNFLISHSGKIEVFVDEISYGSYSNFFFSNGVKIGTKFFKQLPEDEKEDLMNMLNYIMLVASKKLYVTSEGKRIPLFPKETYGSNFSRIGIATTC